MSQDSGDAAVLPPLPPSPPTSGKAGRKRLQAVVLGVAALAVGAAAVVWAVNAAVFDCEGRAREDAVLLQRELVAPLPADWVRQVDSGEQCSSGETGGVQVTLKDAAPGVVPVLEEAGWRRSGGYDDVDVLRKDVDGRHLEAWVGPTEVGASARESSFTSFVRMILS